MPEVEHNSETQNLALAQLLAAPPSPLDRLPGFVRAVEDYAQQFSAQLRVRDGLEGNVSVREIVATSLVDVLDANSNYLGIAVDVADWDSRLAIGLSYELLFAVVEAMFGGDGALPVSIPDRLPTRLERKVAQHFLDSTIYALQKCFSDDGTLRLKVSDIETELGEIDFNRKTSSVVLVRLDVRINNRSGDFMLILPKSVLDGLRKSGLPGDQGAGNSDPVWATQFTRELQRADVQLRAVIRDRSFVLGDIARLAPGSVLPLDADPGTNVYLEANEEPVFVCSMGQMDGRYTVRVNESYDMTRDLMEEITGR